MGPQRFSCGNRGSALPVLLAMLASMGPQRFSCGNAPPVAAPAPFVAASMGPQRFSCGNHAPTLHQIHHQTASMGPQRFSCGNASASPAALGRLRQLQWGRSVSAAETWRRLTRGTVMVSASMGPQRFSCGNGQGARADELGRRRFNGAAAFQLRKPGSHPAAPPPPRCFNGAAAFQLRKPIRSDWSAD